MKASSLLIGLIIPISMLAMEQQLSSKMHALMLDNPVQRAFNNATLLTMPRDIKVCIIRYLVQAEGAADKERLVTAATSIRSLAASNKEFHALIHDPLIMTELMKRLKLQHNAHILVVASVIGTPSSAQSLAPLIEFDPFWALPWGPTLYARDLIKKNDTRALRFFLKIIVGKIVTVCDESLNKKLLNELLFDVVNKPNIMAVVLEFPTININYKSMVKEKTPLAYAKYLLEETQEGRRYHNEMHEKESALKQTIKLLKEHGATE